ncbi:reverse transcriptase domain-containing protein [Tanacetum coccineum]
MFNCAQSLEGMEVVCQEFEATSKDPEGHSVDELITEFSSSWLSAKVSKTFDISLMGASSKSCEYVLDTLMQVFEDKWFAHAVKERTLDNLITEILIWLLDERVPRMHDGSQLLKVLNVLMLKILDNAKRGDVRKRLGPKDARSMSRSPEPRHDRSRSPRRKDLERETMFRRLEKGVFLRLGDKEKAAKVERWAMPTWCHMFNSTLTGNARVWFDDLPPESSYDDLKETFLANYLQQKKCIKDPVEIHHIKQREWESTEDFVRRFKTESRDVKGAPEVMRISGFMHGITNPELIKRLHDKILKSIDEMWKITTAFLRGEVAAGN